MERYRAQCTSPDSEDHDRLYVPVLVHQVGDCFKVRAAHRVKGKVTPASHALTCCCVYTLDCSGNRIPAGFKFGWRNTSNSEAFLSATCKVESNLVHARSLAHGLQSGIKIGLEILNVLDADRDTYEGITDSK